MDFRYDDELVQFADSVRRWAAERYNFDTRRTVLASATGTSDDVWRGLADLGVLALPVPQAHDGLGARALDLLPLLTELGRGMVAEPWQSTWLAARVLALTGGHPLLSAVATGQARLACAFAEPAARHDLLEVRTSATAKGDGYVLQGHKSGVAHGAQAGHLMVSARTGGGPRERDGISLFLVAADTPGLRITDRPSLDGQRVASVELDAVRVPASARLGAAGQGWAVLEAATDYGCALLCGEAIGLMTRINDDTLAYLKTRQQFGQPIGSFQALQHRMVDMTTHLVQARSITLLALASVDGQDESVRRRHVSAAKARVGKAMRYVGQQGIQLHGGMGMTDELAMTHAVRRMAAIELTLGDTDHHLRRFMAESQAPAAALQVAA